MGPVKPYSDRTDIERLQSSWKKLNGLMKRGEWSAAVTRAATAAEIAANIAIRHELIEQRKLESEFVDHLLRWANGLAGKLRNIIRPLYSSKNKTKIIKALEKAADSINDQRNLVVHSGNFMNEEEAIEVFEASKQFIESLLGQYHPGFKL